MSNDVTIRALAWISFWFLLFGAFTIDLHRVVQDWHSYQQDQTSFPVPHSDWG